ncbi:hypothetical protein ACFE04_020427 [Oxalis oulophora]
MSESITSTRRLAVLSAHLAMTALSSTLNHDDADEESQIVEPQHKADLVLRKEEQRLWCGDWRSGGCSVGNGERRGHTVTPMFINKDESHEEGCDRYWVCGFAGGAPTSVTAYWKFWF